MKNTKKVIAVVLAVAMLLSAMVMSVVAYTQGDASDTKVNFKFEVSQVSKVVMDSNNNSEGTAGAYNAINNDIYAVTISIKSLYGVDGILMPCMYNAEHYDLLSYVDGDDASNSGAFIGFDSSEPSGHSYVWGLGKGWSDVGGYTATGAVAANAKQTKCFGLGNASATKVWPSITMMDSAQADWAEWTAGIADTAKTGVIKVYINDTAKAKNALLNVYQGKIADDYIDVVTLFFIRKDTVAEEACYGDVFGIVGTDKREPDASGFTSGATSQTVALESGNTTGIPYGNSNIVNAAVEAAIKPIASYTSTNGVKAHGIMFFLADGATKTYTTDDIDKVDYRFVVQFSNTAFPITSSDNYATFSTAIDEVGFVMAKVSDGKTVDELKAADIASLSKDSGTIRKCWTEKISTDAAGDSSFVFSCRIKGIAVTGGVVADEYIAVPYIISGGTTTYGEAMTSDAQGRFNANVAKFLASKNA